MGATKPRGDDAAARVLDNGRCMTRRKRRGLVDKLTFQKSSLIGRQADKISPSCAEFSLEVVLWAPHLAQR